MVQSFFDFLARPAVWLSLIALLLLYFGLANHQTILEYIRALRG
jgi:hypothetical protein